MKTADKDEVKEQYVGKDCVFIFINSNRINTWVY